MNKKLFWRLLGCFFLFVVLFPAMLIPITRSLMDLTTTGVSECSDIQKWGYAFLAPMIFGLIGFLNIVIFYRKEFSE